MNYIRFSILLVICLPHYAFSQQPNLIPNPGFEKYKSLPFAQAQGSFVQDWTNPNESGMAYPHPTPDYFHTDGRGDAMLPVSYYGTVEAHTGKGIMGIFTKEGYYEYTSTKLVEPLVKGKLYRAVFHLTHGQERNYAHSGTSSVGLLFTQEPTAQVQSERIKVQPQVSTPRSLGHTEWERVSFVFRADRDHRYMTVGFFEETIEECYYFLDDFELMIVEEATHEDEKPERNQNQANHLGRVVDIQEVVTVSEPLFTVSVYDNQQADGDVISIYFNGNTLLDEAELIKKPHKIELFIHPDQENILIMHAHSLGEHPPNTAAISFKLGKERYYFQLGSTLTHSGALKFRLSAIADAHIRHIA